MTGRRVARAALMIAVVLGWLQLGLANSYRLDYLDRVNRIGSERARAAPDVWGVLDASGSGSDSPGRSARTEPPHLLPSQFEDAYVWLTQVRYMRETGRWRLHETPFDNAPEGREVHWSSLYAWWLIALGWLFRLVTGADAAASLERASLFASPILHGLLLPLLAWVATRRLGGWAGAVVVLSMVAAYPIAESFFLGNIDHHGLIVASGVGTVLCLLAGGGGWVGQRGRTADSTSGEREKASTARRWFVASAACGAVGLWVSAVSQTMVLAGVAAGAVAAAAFRGRKHGAGDPVSADPELWRLWGWAGAVLSLGFYLLEVFPSHMAMRLEVNHPLYALAWLGEGEILCQWWRWRARASTSPGRRPLVLGLGAVACLPLAVWGGGATWYVLRDPFMWRLHQFIEEFRPLIPLLARGDQASMLQALSPLPLYLIIGLGLVSIRRLRVVEQGLVLIALGPALVFGALAFWQLRWVGAWMALLAPLAAACTAYLPGVVRGARVARIAAIALLAAPAVGLIQGGVEAVAEARAQSRSRSVTAEDLASLVLRDVALAVADQSGDPSRAVVLASPHATIRLSYFGRLPGVGTLYWENLPGLETSAELFACGSAGEARLLLTERGITHIVLFSEHSFIGTYFLLARGYLDREEARNTFFWRLLGGAEPPAWLRPLPYQPPVESIGQRRIQVRIFEVVY